MIFGRPNLPPNEAAQDLRWRFGAWFWFLTSITITILTPYVSQLWVDNKWSLLKSDLITVTVQDWPAVYATVAIMTLVAYEIGHFKARRMQTQTPPAFMSQMVEELADKAGISLPFLRYDPHNKASANASSSLLFGHRITWQGSFKKFSPGEIFAVLAHEVAHLTMQDTRTALLQHLILGGLRVLALIQGLIMMIALVVCFLNLFPWWASGFVLVFPIVYALLRRTEDAFVGGCFAFVLLCAKLSMIEIAPPLVFAFTTSFVGTVLAVLAAHAQSRITEFRADAVAIDLAGPEYADDLARALDKFYHLACDTDEKKRRYRNMSILLMSHPRIVDRVLAMEQKQLKDYFDRHHRQKYT